MQRHTTGGPPTHPAKASLPSTQPTRLYDHTVASAYYRAIRQVEGVPDQPANTDLLTLVDVLEAGALDQAQQEAAQALRAGILALDVTPSAEEKPDNSLESERARV